jgi:hypothetical protein
MRKWIFFLVPSMLLARSLQGGAQTSAGNWPNGSADLNDGWHMHSGDNPAWA